MHISEEFIIDLYSWLENVMKKYKTINYDMFDGNINYRLNDKKLFSYYVLLANSKDVKSFREKLKSIALVY